MEIDINKIIALARSIEAGFAVTVYRLDMKSAMSESNPPILFNSTVMVGEKLEHPLFVAVADDNSMMLTTYDEKSQSVIKFNAEITADELNTQVAVSLAANKEVINVGT